MAPCAVRITISHVPARPPLAADLIGAEPLRLHPPSLRRTDSNSPLLRRRGRSLAFVSHYLPLGHTLRTASDGPWPGGPFEPVRLIDDPTPQVGKWLQSIWQAPGGELYGWYHAEELVRRTPVLFLPHIGALASDDDGRTWRLLGDLMRVPFDAADLGYRNGFLAGGYGDFCVVPDRAGEWFYLHYTCYVPDERLQGVSVLRYPMAAREQPARLELWRDGAWRPKGPGDDGTPILPVRRGWRHRDPAAFWGPAIHYNRDLDVFVMLLNWTEDGAADLVQQGVFASFNVDIANPGGWSAPLQIVRSGSWYPQAIGLGPDDGDTTAGKEARFFMSGFSAWTIRFREGPATEPLTVAREDFGRLFGRAPW